MNYRNSRLRYQTVHSGGVRANKPVGLITGIPAGVFTKYVSGSGVGSTSTFARRAKLRRSMVCKSGCGKFIYPLDQPNTNINGWIDVNKLYLEQLLKQQMEIQIENSKLRDSYQAPVPMNLPIITEFSFNIIEPYFTPFEINLTQTHDTNTFISIPFQFTCLGQPYQTNSGGIPTFGHSGCPLKFTLTFPNPIYNIPFTIINNSAIEQNIVSSGKPPPPKIDITITFISNTIVQFTTINLGPSMQYSGIINFIIE